MDVSEAFVKAASSAAPAEDLIARTPHFLAVIDGAGDPLARRVRGARLGLLAAQALERGVLALAPDATVDQAVGRLNAELRALRADLGITAPPWPTASVALASRSRRAVWRVGAVSVRIGDVVSRAVHPPEDIRRAYRAAYLSAALATGVVTEDVLRGRHAPGDQDPLLTVQHVFQNRDVPLGYGAIDGESVPPRFVDSFSIPDDVDVVLASDGYPVVEGTLAESEAALRVSLDIDPLRIGDHAETKPVRFGADSFDDRAYVRLRFAAASPADAREASSDQKPSR